MHHDKVASHERVVGDSGGRGLGLGQQALYRDAGIKQPLRIWTDSSAAVGTAGRQGLGKRRHLECHTLWLQHRLRQKAFELRKVQGEKNPADVFTKHTESAAKLTQLMSLFNCQCSTGRPDAAPQLKRSNFCNKHLQLHLKAHIKEMLVHHQLLHILLSD